MIDLTNSDIIRFAKLYAKACKEAKQKQSVRLTDAQRAGIPPKPPGWRSVMPWITPVVFNNPFKPQR